VLSVSRTSIEGPARHARRIARTIRPLLGLLLLAGCPAPSVPPRPQPHEPALAARSAPSASSAPSPSAASPREALRSAELTVLFTSDEHGWVAPRESEGRRWGGASQLLATLVEREHLCPGPSEAPATPGPERCAEADTVLLSGGDNYTGPVISTYFRGATMAEAMGRLGYVASALGNHELDFERSGFEANRKLAGLRYLAANVASEPGVAQDLVQPFVLVHRAGITLGVVGLATTATPRTAVASRFAGLRFEDPETALARVVPEVWHAGADVVVVLAHECAAELEPMLARHPEWQLAFVGTGHCHKPVDHLVGAVAVMSPGWRLDHYARVRLAIDRSGHGPRRATVLDHQIVDVASAQPEPAPTVDPALDQKIAAWQAQVDQALGEVIGFSASGLVRDSPALGQWVVEPWRLRFKADVALTTRGSIRQDLAAGPVTLATVQSILPFENELVVVQIPGRVLLDLLARPGTIAAGVTRGRNGSFGLRGRGAIQPAARYRIVTTDFLYGGGDDFPLRQADPAATFTGVGWRVPVIEWTKARRSSASQPLERALGTQ
jgi:5'-nucleotidase / UDP-sugar diphosphatase